MRFTFNFGIKNNNPDDRHGLNLGGRIAAALRFKICWGKDPALVDEPCLILFPIQRNLLNCGLAGIVSFAKGEHHGGHIDLAALSKTVQFVCANGYEACQSKKDDFYGHYLGGDQAVKELLATVQKLKHEKAFLNLCLHSEILDEVTRLAERVTQTLALEEPLLLRYLEQAEPAVVKSLNSRVDVLKDIGWCLSKEIVENVGKVGSLIGETVESVDADALKLYKRINTVLNSIDRLEVRGRDSAGLSLLFITKQTDFEQFKGELQQKGLMPEFERRLEQQLLTNRHISLHAVSTKTDNFQLVSIAFTYKVAAEIGSLGENVDFIRQQIKTDSVLKNVVKYPFQYHTISSHTRWASVGAINELNCHPVGHAQSGGHTADKSAIIHVCLNGDIDNYLELKEQLLSDGIEMPREVTTDTQIIPFQIDRYVQKGADIKNAFRLAVNDFQGSHAISMHTDLAPGKLFLAQKGSGQTIFIGIAEDHYMPTSEVYGFVEETPYYVKMNGEQVIQGKQGPTQGQLFILDQDSGGGLDGIDACYYDGTAIRLTQADIQQTQITSRDIDRQEFPHYFLKEISESPHSVHKTLQSRWRRDEQASGHYKLHLNEKEIPQELRQKIARGLIRRIFFVGQGTAGVAAQCCADIFNYFINDPSIQITALKASELSGFKMSSDDDTRAMADTMVIAISQSGTTTDTNRTVDMVKERGAATIAIVNRRDSDITFKVDGVLYTSSGRDIEMSVASTKAFYSQIVAGSLLGLFFAQLRGRLPEEVISEEVRRLIELPQHMRTVLTKHKEIGASAQRHALSKTYWATVGSGPNKSAADEIRIKLSELCYKTISSDYIEDKKHIDLSSEPLIIMCAAGSSGTVIGDIIKDTAIFQAHKATPVVIADEGETRFEPYAADVLYVPMVAPHLAPVLNTLAGHIWGYYAALAINQGSVVLDRFRQKINSVIDDQLQAGQDIYEVILERNFREEVAKFYNSFRKLQADGRFPAAMAPEAAADLPLLLKYLAGRLPVTDFEVDFGIKGTAANIIHVLNRILGRCINTLSRPVDAIKHQAKTVTVGTSRIQEKFDGPLFEQLSRFGFNPSNLINRNVLVLRNLQGVIADIQGVILYNIGNLSLLGELTDEATITVVKKEGVLAPIPSRVETDHQLKGTKRIIVERGNVYIGKGRKDGRSIVVIPVISTVTSGPNIIEHLLLLNIAFQEKVSLETKIRALGGKYDHIKNIVQENSIFWQEQYVDLVAIDDLFGKSAEKIGEAIVAKVQQDSLSQTA